MGKILEKYTRKSTVRIKENMKSIERKSTVNQYDKIYERVNKLYCLSFFL